MTTHDTPNPTIMQPAPAPISAPAVPPNPYQQLEAFNAELAGKLNQLKIQLHDYREALEQARSEGGLFQRLLNEIAVNVLGFENGRPFSDLVPVIRELKEKAERPPTAIDQVIPPGSNGHELKELIVKMMPQRMRELANLENATHVHTGERIAHALERIADIGQSLADSAQGFTDMFEGLLSSDGTQLDVRTNYEPPPDEDHG